MSKQIKPPFTLETAKQKVQLAEALWNGKNPERIALAYTEDSRWYFDDDGLMHTRDASINELAIAENERTL